MELARGEEMNFLPMIDFPLVGKYFALTRSAHHAGLLK
jgi:hypothetical protein